MKAPRVYLFSLTIYAATMFVGLTLCSTKAISYDASDKYRLVSLQKCDSFEVNTMSGDQITAYNEMKAAMMNLKKIEQSVQSVESDLFSLKLQLAARPLTTNDIVADSDSWLAEDERFALQQANQIEVVRTELSTIEKHEQNLRQLASEFNASIKQLAPEHITSVEVLTPGQLIPNYCDASEKMAGLFKYKL